MNHLLSYLDAPGGTYYAFPTTQSLADWATHRVLLEEDAAPNAGRYLGIVDSDVAATWIVFAGGAQPANWGIGLEVLSVSSATAAAQTTLEALKAGGRAALNVRLTDETGAFADLTPTDKPA